MGYVTRLMIVAAEDQALAKSLCDGMAGESAKDMFTVPMAATEAGPASHYVSFGPIEEEFALILGDAQATYDRCGGTVPLANIEAMYSRATIREVNAAQETYDELGLVFVKPQI